MFICTELSLQCSKVGTPWSLRGTIISRLSTQLGPTQFVHTQLVGAYFRVQGFPNRLCFATMSKKPNVKHLNLENGVIFKGFDSLYKQVLDIKDQPLCPKVQAELKETFDDLKKSLESFQGKIQAVGLKAKCKTSKLRLNGDS